jgi:hypothetical protein
MRITVNPVLDMETLTWVANDGVYDYTGPILLFGGKSAEAKANEAAQQAFYAATTAQQATTFSEQQDLYNSVKAVTAPIIAAGPNQYGYSPAEDALLRSTIEDTASQATANAITGTQLREKQATGGTDVLGTGGSAQLEATANILGEQSKAKQIAQEKLSGYAAGNLNYENALNALSGVTGSPTAYTSAASGVGQAATGAIQLADSERSTLLSSLLGGAIKGVTEGATGGLGTAVSTLGSGNFGW